MCIEITKIDTISDNGDHDKPKTHQIRAEALPEPREPEAVQPSEEPSPKTGQRELEPRAPQAAQSSRDSGNRGISVSVQIISVTSVATNRIKRVLQSLLRKRSSQSLLHKRSSQSLLRKRSSAPRLVSTLPTLDPEKLDEKYDIDIYKTMV
jgi:hypothetical protein